jgi:molecular chaperone HtpG
MPLLPPVPDSLTQCELYRALQQKDTKSHGLTDRVDAFVNAVDPLLESIIGGPFSTYTLHNPAHAKKLVHIVGTIVPKQTLGAFTALDCALIIQACYLHDAGLSLSASERDAIMKSDEFHATIRAWPELERELERARQLVGHAKSAHEQLDAEELVYQLHQAAAAAFMRPRHATKERYRALVETIKKSAGRPDVCHLRGVSFEDTLILICESHNLDAGVLAETLGPYEDRFPRRLAIAGEYANVQFVAAVLRIADILDFDRERTPRVLFEHLGINSSVLPGSQVSIAEWQKHMAVHSIDVGQTELVISAESAHPAIEKTIREFCVMIEHEIRDTTAILRRNTAEVADTYVCSLPTNIRANVRPNGYIYRDLSFRLDESAVMALLMGDQLYSSKHVPIRELIQNAIDACRVRAILDHGGNVQVDVNTRYENDEWWIDVSDNGIGMDEFVLSEYFFRIGKQYYGSSSFRTLVGDETVTQFIPIARFGIGVASVFMIADLIQVETQAFASTRGDLERRRLSVSSNGGLAFITALPSGKAGTTVSVRLKPQVAVAGQAYITALGHYLDRTVVRPAVPVHVRLNDKDVTYRPDTVLELSEDGANALLERGLEAVVLDVGSDGTRIRGRVALVFFRDAEGRLTHAKGGRYRLKKAELSSVVAGAFSGSVSNRITVNGFAMSTQRVARVFRFLSRHSEVIVDCDVVGDRTLQYNVAREHIDGPSGIELRHEIRNATLEALSRNEAWSRLHLETRTMFRNLSDGRMDDDEREIDPDVVSRIKAQLPAGPWPSGIHKKIASELGLSNTVVNGVLTILRRNRRLASSGPSMADD